MKRRSLESLLGRRAAESYAVQYEYIIQLISEQKIKPVKKSPLNGKKPALHTAYWIVEEKKDYSELIEELRFRVNPAISVDYYLAHPDIYEEERGAVIKLNEFLLTIQEMIFRMHLEKQSYDKALDDIRNVFSFTCHMSSSAAFSIPTAFSVIRLQHSSPVCVLVNPL